MVSAPLLAAALAVLVLLGALVAWRLLARLDALAERLDGLAARERDEPPGGQTEDGSATPVASATLEARLAELAEEQRRLATIVLERLAEAPVGRLRPDGDLPDEADPPEAVARAWLSDHGFEQVHLLPAEPGEPGCLAWEARRGTLLHKGLLRVHAGRVEEHSCRSVAGAFP